MYDQQQKDTISSDFVDDILDDYDYLMGCAASARDCTGLIPAGQVTEDELLSYKDVYSFPPPAVVAEKARYDCETNTKY